MSTYDGGPAFPVPEAYHADSVELYQSSDTGMTLRDWFAGQALSGLVASNLYDRVMSLRKSSKEYTPDHYQSVTSFAAGLAYEYADAMLAARNGGAK